MHRKFVIYFPSLLGIDYSEYPSLILFVYKACSVCVCKGVMYESYNPPMGLGQVARGLVMLSVYKTARAPKLMQKAF